MAITILILSKWREMAKVTNNDKRRMVVVAA